jgi:hypothetical protein
LWRFIFVAFYFYLQYVFYYNHIKFIIKHATENKNVPIKPRVYAIDFDNTIAYTQYPKIIKPLPYAMKCLKVLTNDPNSILILWTCREGEYLKQALDFCELYGVKFDYANENCKELIDLYGNDCRKLGADVYIDDKFPQADIEKLWKDWWSWMKEHDYK